MLLAIDVGNTNTVLGLYDDKKLIQHWRVKTDSSSTADELILTFNSKLFRYALIWLSKPLYLSGTNYLNYKN